MASELDHVFICTSMDAAAGDRLIEFGLTEGPSNVHAGQGTSNRRFFFNNAYLELLWVHDPVEAQSVETRPTCLWNRWAGRNDSTSPFGLCFRPTGNDSKAPFLTFDYHPAYLPAGTSIGIGRNADKLAEPFLCYLPFAQRPDSYPLSRRPPFEHAAGFGEITRVEIITPGGPSHSPELESVVGARLVGLRAGGEHLLEIAFDGESLGLRADFLPDLPLRFLW